MKYLHFLLTTDVLIIDELGQLSADQLSTIDIILRTLRRSTRPFGGVLIMGTMDHTQLGAINGWPILFSSHIYTDFVMIQLSHSVRAYGDENFQKVQNLTRMSPRKLLEDPQNKRTFRELVGSIFDFVDSWDNEKIDAHTQRMYATRMPAYEALHMFVESMQKNYGGKVFTILLALPKICNAWLNQEQSILQISPMT